jgi:hypothetical protein
MVTFFFLQNSFVWKEGDIHGDLSIGCNAQVAYQATPKILNEIRSLFVV